MKNLEMLLDKVIAVNKFLLALVPVSILYFPPKFLQLYLQIRVQVQVQVLYPTFSLTLSREFRPIAFGTTTAIFA